MNNNSNVLMVFAECIPVSGYRRSIIYDLPRGDYFLIPNGLFELLQNFEGKTKEELFNCYQNEKETINSYIDFLIKNDLIFFCDEDEVSLFPKLTNQWYSPQYIESVGCQFKNLKNHKYLDEVIAGFNKIGCKSYVFFIYECSIDELYLFSEKIHQSKATSVKFYIQYSELLYVNDLAQLKEKFEEIDFIQVCGYYSDQKNENLNFQKENLYELVPDYKTYPELFRIDINTFFEAQEHNVYYNRRLFIDSNKQLKNTFNSKIDFLEWESVSNPSKLLSSIDESGIKKLWNAKKDKIDICSICEFRYMCIDNRPLNERLDGTWYSNIECNYNPFLAKWEGQQGYMKLKDIGVISNETGLIINHDKIQQIINSEK